MELRRRLFVGFDRHVVRLIERLLPHDAMDEPVVPDRVRATCAVALRELRGQEEVLLPALGALDADERERLGEDLRQVMG